MERTLLQKVRTSKAWVGIGTIGIMAAALLAQIPRTLTYQGLLTDAAGVLVADGQYTLTFSLYDVDQDGTALWTESQTTAVENGVFSVIFGKITPLDLAFDQPYWLGIQVGQETEMTPRIPLTGTAYSFRSLKAEDADSVNGIPASSVALAGNLFPLGQGGKFPQSVLPEGLPPGAHAATHQEGGSDPMTVTTGMIADNAVTAAKIQPAVLSSLDGVSNDDGNVDLVAGSNISITPDDAAKTITIAATGIGGGDITAVYSGAGLTGGKSSGDVTLSIADGGVNTSMIANGTILGDDINTATMIAVAKLQGGGTTGSSVGVYGSNNAIGVKGINTSTGNMGFLGSDSYGVYGESSSTGVYGTSSSGSGVRGYSSSHNGIHGATSTGIAVYGYRSGGGNYAGDFSGNVRVQGTLTKTAGSFKIDHPLDPENKYLQHSFVESPDMMNMYNGNTILDSRGEAWVEFPAWFEALNQDFRYQLTPVGAPASDLFIAEEISSNRFKIAGGKPAMKVSWQVTGIRRDPYAEAHRIQVEEDKSPEERGKYLNPIEYGRPESLGIDYEKNRKMEEEMKVRLTE